MVRSEYRLLYAVVLASTASACASRPAETQVANADTAALVATVTGLSGPEAVRYDPDQDVYFVANFNGRSDALDNNGFISRVRPDGSIESLNFIAGGANGVTLHAPRGMFISGDTLWAADVNAVRGFHRRTGAALVVLDFAAHDVGFLNDIAGAPDGALYVTDTGRQRIYQIRGRTITVALQDSALNRPNGITWDAEHRRFIVVPFGGGGSLLGWQPNQPGVVVLATVPGARLDGIEFVSTDRVIVASQADSSLWLAGGPRAIRLTRTAGAPADIGVDTRRHRIAVPYIALNRVDIFQLRQR